MSIKENFSYPMDERWNINELTDVINFFATIEKAYDKGVSRERLNDQYKKFKQVVPNKSEEKRIFREFQSNSGMQPFLAIKQLKDSEKRKIKVEVDEKNR
ncbi:UPF0223 family protein [Pediococcus stilesii]|uniref:UPF0223 family protein n=2 Tax=Pediococcus stilesii TaxID=331679 RepID=A0A5R9BWV4_9LACO|nr:UPF0223 family protein [Pediococcus stilesii]TLQ04975.1 UPF0223 family protein [Pediococcus stilesii]